MDFCTAWRSTWIRQGRADKLALVLPYQRRINEQRSSVMFRYSLDPFGRAKTVVALSVVQGPSPGRSAPTHAAHLEKLPEERGCLPCPRQDYSATRSTFQVRFPRCPRPAGPELRRCFNPGPANGDRWQPRCSRDCAEPGRMTGLDIQDSFTFKPCGERCQTSMGNSSAGGCDRVRRRQVLPLRIIGLVGRDRAARTGLMAEHQPLPDYG